MTDKEIKEMLEERDPVSHVDMIHLLDKGLCRVIFADRKLGCALRHPCGTVYAAAFTDDVDPLYDAIGDVPLLNSENEALARKYMNGKGWCFREASWTFRYDTSRGFLDEGPWHYRNMEARDLPLFREHYSAVADDSLAGYIERKDMFAMEDDEGTVMGFAGFHPEGSMGLLEIFPEFRRKGLGTHMEGFIINEAMRRGQTPFCNVYVSNVASLNLQRDLGLEKGDILSWWVWPE